LPTLRELQARFARALDGDPGAAETLFLGDGVAAVERIAIHANNSRAAFRTALELSFPVTRRLGGEAWFAGAAGTYRQSRPSRSGDLQPAGAHFPAFLAARLAGTAHEVIADVAALEWACECAAAAPDGPPLDLASLAAVPAERHGELRFGLHPACRLVDSPYPIVEVWEANRSADEPRPVALDAGAQYALVCRRDVVEVHRVDAATFVFLRLIAAGSTLERAVAGATAIDADFPLAALLPRLAALGVLGPARLLD
jgi:hypothetical protein